MKTFLKPGDVVSCYAFYTGRSTPRKVLAVSASGRKLTLERTDWATGKAEFFWQPSKEWYRNDYAGEICNCPREAT